MNAPSSSSESVQVPVLLLVDSLSCFRAIVRIIGSFEERSLAVLTDLVTSIASSIHGIPSLPFCCEAYKNASAVLRGSRELVLAALLTVLSNFCAHVLAGRVVQRMWSRMWRT